MKAVDQSLEMRGSCEDLFCATYKYAYSQNGDDKYQRPESRPKYNPISSPKNFSQDQVAVE